MHFLPLASLLYVLCVPDSGPPEILSARVEGRWVLDADGDPTPAEGFTRGLQPSGLLFRDGELWSAGDQRSRYPGHLFRIDPRTARLIGRPIRLEVTEGDSGSSKEFEAYRGIPNSDFEGICGNPVDPDALFAVTEDKIPWIAEIRLGSPVGGSPPALRATLRRLTRIRFPASLRPWRGDTNFRLEGVTVSDDAHVLYLAFERAHDNLPRICCVSLESSRTGSVVEPEVLNVDFDAVPGRPDKGGALLNLNDIAFFRADGRPHILAVARDQERLLVVDLDAGKVTRVVDLDFRDPSGAAMKWVSPEGLAVEKASNRLWIINDPDSVRGNYRRRESEFPQGHFAKFTPLLFELDASPVLGPVTTKERPAEKP